jgi:hypothetical protein
MEATLNKDQTSTLRDIVKIGKADFTKFDGRTIRALSVREFVKVTENRNGKFVVPTAKGRKILN